MEVAEGLRVLRSDARGVATLFRKFGLAVRYNIRTSSIEICYEPELDQFSDEHVVWKPTRPSCSDEPGICWEPFTDLWSDRIRDSAEMLFVQRVNPLNLNSNVKPWLLNVHDWHSKIRSFPDDVDPFVEWVTLLPEWDGIFRCERVLQELLDVDASDLNRWASKALFLHPLVRAFSPGEPIHDHIVVAGKQGDGKSNLVKYLLPSVWHTEYQPDRGMSKREAMECAEGSVILEWPEMSNLKKQSVEQLKAFLTSSRDRARMAYDRYTTNAERRFMLVMTTNDSEKPLPYDPTGNRRFVVVKVGGCPAGGRKVKEWLISHRHQLWAEAYARWCAGEQGWTVPDVFLPEKLWATRSEHNLDHMDMDESMADAIGDLPSEPMTANKIGNLLGLIDAGEQVLSRADTYRLTDALKTAGWCSKRCRVDGKSTRLWEPPVKPVEPEF